MMKNFATLLTAWQKRSGRKDLPWQKTTDPYKRWVSEIMLQQTQVGTVIPFYLKFIEDFPSVESLARASEEEVLKHWSGLGYYRRAVNLHAGARKIAESGGEFPQSVEALMQIPGIGRSTAGAIVSSCWDRPAPILDGNARRVFSRCFGVRRGASQAAFENELWAIARRELPQSGCRAYTQALMDLGAGVCTQKSPRCADCPLRVGCAAFASGSPESFPGRKAAGAGRGREVRQEAFLMIRGPQGLWLQKRTEKAVWRGLWCFPCVQGGGESRAVREGLRALEAVDADSLRFYRKVQHDFTHYRLEMFVWSVQSAGRSPDLHGRGRWFSRAEAAEGALPAPVKKLALEFLSGSAQP
ncbi:A/G-specific adenine glycosylase [Mesosutterella sp. OilRF-GAM-744-9]|uniref:Adenine DNA glycosylase n=1 Tax=Mesosutterella porci TaxID=2915351 RepID=A0ABS9MQC1_9BURK|nr:A/G-specific adenine glycosylase [Mesosutterella sp. oilRF-744-WT-GAM-9]MCG5030233.1 A/G-specific adenine glycosylase [Mesosutterella sp. oilRF-744-WT-GAM-9]